jgi:hypothetical protein
MLTPVDNRESWEVCNCIGRDLSRRSGPEWTKSLTETEFQLPLILNPVWHGRTSIDPLSSSPQDIDWHTPAHTPCGTPRQATTDVQMHSSLVSISSVKCHTSQLSRTPTPLASGLPHNACTGVHVAVIDQRTDREQTSHDRNLIF